MLWLLAIAALLVLGGSSASAADGGGSKPTNVVPPPKGVDMQGVVRLREAVKAAGLPRPWQDFFAFVALRESKGHATVGRGIAAGFPQWAFRNNGPSEAAAAKRAYNRNAADLVGCWPEVVYTAGSYGKLAMIPANAVEVFRGTDLACIHPWALMDAQNDAPTTIAGIGYAKRLMGWSSYKARPTVLTLRVGWASPDFMDDVAVMAAKRSEYEDELRMLGIPTSFLDSTLPPIPDFDPVELYGRLGGNWGWLPEEVA